MKNITSSIFFILTIATASVYAEEEYTHCITHVVSEIIVTHGGYIYYRDHNEVTRTAYNPNNHQVYTSQLDANKIIDLLKTAMLNKYVVLEAVYPRSYDCKEPDLRIDVYQIRVKQVFKDYERHYIDDIYSNKI